MKIPFDAWACPIDYLPLLKKENSLICAQNHSFDYARKGYIHLLPPQFKKTNHPGDNKEMVQARRLFLDAGYYQPIATAVCQAVHQYARGIYPQMRFIDAGCGEGYYTDQIKKQLQAFYPDCLLQFLGFDISKESVAAAAGRYKEIDWAVATNAHIPVLNNTLDGVFSLFGFPVYTAFQRVLKTNGLLIIADTGIHHLIELRQAVYDTVYLKEKKESDEIAGFQLIEKIPVTYVLSHISFPLTDALLKMTPHYYRMRAEKYQQFATCPPQQIHVDVCIKVYRKIS